MKKLWVEKYRPKTITEYVFRDDAQRKQVQSWVDSGDIPHLLFSGVPGVGKTTLAKVLLNEINAENGDVLIINGSQEGRKIEIIRDVIENFCSVLPFGDRRYVLIDEADYLNPNSVQPALRSLMERHSDTCRFILTCNWANRIIHALHSRCQGFHFERLDETDFSVRVAEILKEEDVEFSIDVLDSYTKAYYPDLRKCINSCQMNAQTGILMVPRKEEAGSTEYMVEMVELFNAGKIREARKLVCAEAVPEEYEDIFRFLYRNLHYWGDTENKQDEAVLVIRDGLVKHTTCADPEINLAATLINLQLIK